MTVQVMSAQRLTSSKQQGFTLVELIIVIVITSIIAVGSTGFIVNTVKGLNDVSRRDALANNLRINMSKISLQINQSLAGSARIQKGKNFQCIEMLPIRASSFYLTAPIQSKGSKIQAISLTKKVIGLRAILGIPAKQQIYLELTKANSQAVSTAISLQSNQKNSPYSQLTLSKAMQYSKGSKLQKIHYVDTPVSYCIEKGNLYRYSNYRATAKQPLPSIAANKTHKRLPKKEPKRVLLAQGIRQSSTFSLQQEQSVYIALSAGDKQENLTINQQVWLADE